MYNAEPALHRIDFDSSGFEWIDCDDSQQSILSLMRKDQAENQVLIAVGNFTPVPRLNYQVGAPFGGFWKEILNSDASEYGGSGQGNLGGVEAQALKRHGRPYSLKVTLPPLGIVFFKHDQNAS
jgi:1,4-alpha-glucan branching enzyme